MLPHSSFPDKYIHFAGHINIFLHSYRDTGSGRDGVSTATSIAASVLIVRPRRVQQNQIHVKLSVLFLCILLFFILMSKHTQVKNIDANEHHMLK